MSEGPAPYIVGINEKCFLKAKNLKCKDYMHDENLSLVHACGFEFNSPELSPALFDIIEGMTSHLFNMEEFFIIAMERVPPRFLALIVGLAQTGSLFDGFFPHASRIECLIGVLNKQGKNQLNQVDEVIQKPVNKDLFSSLIELRLSSERVEALEQFIVDDEVSQTIKAGVMAKVVRNIFKE